MSTTATGPDIHHRLIREWEASWAQTLHAFPHGKHTAGQVLSQIRTSPRSEADQIMLGLLREAGAGDQACARTALQVMLPKCVSLARSCKGLSTLDPQEAISVVVAIMWERVSSYPMARTTSVIGNLAMDALKAVTRAFPPALTLESPVDPLVLSEGRSGDSEDTQHWPSSIPAAEPAAVTQAEENFHELYTVLAWSRDHNLLSAEDVALLVRYSTSSSAEKTAMAQHLQISMTALRKRAHRIRCTLIQAVQDYALTRADLQQNRFEQVAA